MLFFKQEKISYCSDLFFRKRKINNGCFFERGWIVVAFLIGQGFIKGAVHQQLYNAFNFEILIPGGSQWRK